MSNELGMQCAVELKPCPFCGCEMGIESNRDWHILMGDHSETCFFEQSDQQIYPATDDGMKFLLSIWNVREDPSKIEMRCAAYLEALEDIARGPLQGPGDFSIYAQGVAKRAISTPAGREYQERLRKAEETAANALTVMIEKAQECGQLESELERCKSDAERYRWLRDCRQSDEMLERMKFCGVPEAVTDSMIDAAMEASHE